MNNLGFGQQFFPLLDQRRGANVVGCLYVLAERILKLGDGFNDRLHLGLPSTVSLDGRQPEMLPEKDFFSRKFLSPDTVGQ